MYQETFVEINDIFRFSLIDHSTLIQQNHFIGIFADTAQVMAYHQQCFSHFPELFEFAEAFCLEENISDRKCLIDNQDLRFNVNGNGKSQTDKHTAGVRFYRLIDEFTDIRKTQDIIHSCIDFLS